LPCIWPHRPVVLDRLGPDRIYAIDPAARSRMSGLLFLTAYVGAAACSAVISAFWGSWQWRGTCGFALVLVLLAVAVEHATWRTKA